VRSRWIAEPTSWRFQGRDSRIRPPGRSVRERRRCAPVEGGTEEVLESVSARVMVLLSWHRMCLHFFASMVGAEVVKLGGPSDWGLPYSNYSDAKDPDARLLPPAFRSATKADGSPNALFVATRTADCNARRQFADDADVAVATPLREPEFQSLDFGTGRQPFRETESSSRTSRPCHFGRSIEVAEAAQGRTTRE
jgi:tyrosinase